MQVFVLLYNAGTENEGIHTLKIGDRNVVLMFEAEDDATRYAMMLEAQDFGSPDVESLDDEEVEEFCQSAGYESKLVPDGSLAVPPETNLESPDWSPDAASPELSEPGTSVSEKPEFSNSELDRIRRQLEGLL
ncbi:MAG: DUF3110 domain-containing protein [Leptolyngbyaceae cyanobacterium RM2_2_4]|nr:DUF3110 domain-containing protein [Leptolyngbyaceae cyanobacterium SM1_4_3]NJN59757.1 DUF3110 domain-containing protein [Leptolyngbyaceae cyanobacterium SL_5_9]NJO51722.1 DUF3110 domain-containing protein [Leptolyngbyaceae cyanobacterium RM2_2_4]NJO67309.1 DUF3110 domain-containing protein [Leptolyngbyaceae cyanobacterium RM1_405_57]